MDSNQKMTERERLELAEKLDKQLDDFINSLEKKKYSDGWSEDTWKEEIDKHPFFMKKAPEPGEEVHPMMEGLQQLKFDPDENTPEELAEKYKEDGNYWMKHKKYNIAIMNYTEGLLQKQNAKSELKANLYNNRSYAQFLLKNYRSSYADAKEALKFKNDYGKAKLRMLKCNMELKKYEDVCNDCEKFLSNDPDNQEIITIQKEALTKRSEKLRDQRRHKMEEKKKRQQFQTLIQVLIERKVKFEEIGFDTTRLSTLTFPDILKPKIEPLEDTPVSLDAQGNIYWPIVFCYPEYLTTDIQQQVHEMKTIYECLEEMFSSLDRNSSNDYTIPKDVNVYYENRVNGKMIKVDPRESIKEIISNAQFWIYNGYLTFYVVPANSDVEKDFLNQKREARVVC